MDPPEVPIPEIPSLAEAEIVRHPASGNDCLLATTEGGERIAFGFETGGDTPGLQVVDPALWLAAADPERTPAGFTAVKEPQADDWLQAVITHPVGAEWLSRIKKAHPDAYHRWFAQEDYEDGGEGGAG